jgi:hypothetical protein
MANVIDQHVWPLSGWEAIRTGSSLIEVGPNACPGSASKPPRLPHGHRQKPLRGLLVEHPLNQLELFFGMPLLKGARRNTKRLAIEHEEQTIGRATHGPS